jgi:hypothetical protein
MMATSTPMILEQLRRSITGFTSQQQNVFWPGADRTMKAMVRLVVIYTMRCMEVFKNAVDPFYKQGRESNVDTDGAQNVEDSEIEDMIQGSSTTAASVAQWLMFPNTRTDLERHVVSI